VTLEHIYRQQLGGRRSRLPFDLWLSWDLPANRSGAGKPGSQFSPSLDSIFGRQIKNFVAGLSGAMIGAVLRRRCSQCAAQFQKNS
jgi:hypothetical protein